MLHPKAITLKQLRALAAIVDSGSITAAANMLHVTPPAVSTQLRGLEDVIGAKTLNRGPDGRISLTPVGAELLGTVRQIETALELCFKRVTALKKGLAGYVSIGVVSTGKYFAPGLVARMKAIHPEIEIGLKVGNRDHMLDMLAHGEVEMAIMGRPPQEPLNSSDTLGDHPYVIIAAPEHPLASQGCVSPEELLNETFLTREVGSGTRILMTRYLDRIGEGSPYRSI